MIHVFIHIKRKHVYTFTRLHSKVSHCLKQWCVRASPLLLVTSPRVQRIAFASYAKDRSKSRYITFSLPFLSPCDNSTGKMEIKGQFYRGSVRWRRYLILSTHIWFRECVSPQPFSMQTSLSECQGRSQGRVVTRARSRMADFSRITKLSP